MYVCDCDCVGSRFDYLSKDAIDVFVNIFPGL